MHAILIFQNRNEIHFAFNLLKTSEYSLLSNTTIKTVKQILPGSNKKLILVLDLKIICMACIYFFIYF